MTFRPGWPQAVSIVVRAPPLSAPGSPRAWRARTAVARGRAPWSGPLRRHWDLSHGSPLGRDYSVTPTLLRRRPGAETGQSRAEACLLSPVRALPTALQRRGSRHPQWARARQAGTLRGRDPDERRERCVPNYAASGEVVLGARLQHDLRLSPKSGVPDLRQRGSLSSRNMAQSPPTSRSRSPPCDRVPSYNRDRAPGRPACGTGH